MKNNFSYFKNKDCKYFPCHKTEDEDFNCLFCYCPLYALGDKCGGDFTYTKDGIKDCSDCLIPHNPDNYQKIIDKFPQIASMIKHNNSK